MGMAGSAALAIANTACLLGKPCGPANAAGGAHSENLVQQRHGVGQILQFAEDEFTQIVFSEKGMHSGSAEFHMSDLHPSTWNGQTLMQVLELAQMMHFESWPKPAGWKGANGLEGVLCGLTK